MPSASDFLLRLPRQWLPLSVEKPCQRATNSEIRRWLRQRAVVMNGVALGEHDPLPHPLRTLVFFPRGARKTTYWTGGETST